MLWVQSLKMNREGESYILVYKSMIEIIDTISHKLSGQYVRFITWFGTVLIYYMIWNRFDLHHDLKPFCFTTWFETVLFYYMIWNRFVLLHDLKPFWFTTWFGTVLIYNMIRSPYIRRQRLCLSRTNVLGTRQTVYINTRVIRDRYICDLSDGTLLLVF